MGDAKRAVTVERLLSNARAMDDFIHQLAYLDLDNCSGSAYRAVRLCRYDRGMLLSSDHSTFNYCHISVASIPTAKIVRGDQDSRYAGNPDPRVSEGELVCVWSSGRWVKDGPWIPLIREWLGELIEMAEVKRGEIRRKEQEEREARLKAQQAKKDALLAAWS